MFHIQLHPGEPDRAIEYAINVPTTTHCIGLDFDIEEFAPQLNNLSLEHWGANDFTIARDAHIAKYGNPGTTQILEHFYHLQIGDIGLVRGGATPVALVRIIGPYQFVQNPPGNYDWFRHRFPVVVIERYKDYIIRYPAVQINPPAQGTFQLLTNQSPTRLALEIWIASIDQMNIEKAATKRLADQLIQSKQTLLSGPPGPSKTWHAKKIAKEILGSDADNEFEQKQGILWNIVQFHPAYNYEDFVRGIQVSTNADGHPQYKTVNRIFAQMALDAYNDDESWNRLPENERPEAPPKYVLIIDEINRAHLAAVLGELIYGLEYRGSPITTPYAIADAIEPFGGNPYSIIVPPNLFIIGTMNTADRSIGHIDYAVRRRFAFVPMPPDKLKLKLYYSNNQHPSHENKALALFDSVAGLFHGDNSKLSPEFYADDVQPGHTYFMADTSDKLANKFIYQIYPLLREYIKDGILLPTDGIIRLPINNITIEPVMRLTALEDAVMYYLKSVEIQETQGEPKNNDNPA